jgi:hypothetical protein
LLVADKGKVICFTYKETSIIVGTDAAIWSKKLTFGLLATISLEVVRFCTYAPFPALLPFFKCILEVVFCKGVQRRSRFCLNHLSCIKMAAFQFYLQSGKQTKVGWVWLKIPWLKRKCGMVHCHDATASSFVTNVQGKIFTHFHAVAIKVIVVCRIDCLACQDEYLVNNPLDVKENYKHALDFYLGLSYLFQSQ